MGLCTAWRNRCQELPAVLAGPLGLQQWLQPQRLRWQLRCPTSTCRAHGLTSLRHSELRTARNSSKLLNRADAPGPPFSLIAICHYIVRLRYLEVAKSQTRAVRYCPPDCYTSSALRSAVSAAFRHSALLSGDPLDQAARICCSSDTSEATGRHRSKTMLRTTGTSNMVNTVDTISPPVMTAPNPR